MKTPNHNEALVEELTDLIYAVREESDIRNVRGIIDREMERINGPKRISSDAFQLSNPSNASHLDK